MLKKKMAAGVVALAMFSTLGLAACTGGTSSSSSSDAEQSYGPGALPTVTDGKLTVATSDPAYSPWILNNDPASGEGYESAVIYALAEDVFESEIEKLSERVEGYESWQKAFLTATSFAAENKRMILHLHNSAHSDILARYYYKTILTTMLSYIRKEAEGLNVSESQIMALARFYTAALAGLTLEWIGSGMKGEPDAFLADLGDMLDGNIRRSLERGCAHTAQ